MSGHVSGTEPLSFYDVGKVADILGMAQATVPNLTNNGLLLAVRLNNEGDRSGRDSNRRYAAPYVDALRREMDATGATGSRVARRVALASAGQVDAMIGAFTMAAETRAQGAAQTLSRTALTELFGWKSKNTVANQEMDRRPSVAEVLGRVTWEHLTIPEVPFLTSGQISADHLGILWVHIAQAAKEGKLLAQRLRFSDRNPGRYRFPEPIIAYERDYANEHGLDHYASVMSTSSGRGQPRNWLERVARSRFVASVYRQSPTGYLSVDEAARLTGVAGKTMVRYGWHDTDEFIPRAMLLENVVWSKPPLPDQPPASGIFDPRFDVQWHHPETDSL